MAAVDVLVVDHPLAQTRLTALRDEQTDSGAFRFALHELTTMLVYEATRGSLEHCCRLLAERGATEITVLCVLAAPEGIARLDRSGLPLRLVTAAIDERLNDKMFIVPGLGDAGDRQFGGMPRF